jgi:hypothetical protein
MSPDTIELINSIGLPLAALVIVTTAFVTRRIVTRGELDDMRAQRDQLATELREAAEEFRHSNELLARAMESLVDPVETNR